MELDPQFITTPNGGELVVIPRADYDRLVELVEDARDIAYVSLTSKDQDFAIPGEVLEAIFAGDAPVKAWRKYHGLTQAQLAERTGLSQPAIANLETRLGVGMAHSLGSPATQRKLRTAFGIPAREMWALNPVGDDQDESQP